MKANKTTQNSASAREFISSVENSQKREDAEELLELFSQITKEQPIMWGSSIIGFGKIHYKYASGREGEWMATGFSPRKQNLALYLLSEFPERQELLDKLGKHKTGKACVYINRLSDIDLNVLKKLIKKSFAQAIKTQKMC